MRAHYLDLLYESLHHLRDVLGDYYTLERPLPLELKRPGINFHFDSSILRQNGKSFKIVRVGRTGAPLKLLFHRGHENGGGRHRLSNFREHVGRAMMHKEKLHHLYPGWGKAEPETDEHHLEVKTSTYIRPLPFLHLPELDNKKRKIIECRSIELLSNRNQPVQIDVPHADWLGHHLPGKVAESHLWNTEHVDGFDAQNEERYAELIELINDTVNKIKAA
jgi:hypothetical protein